VAVAILKRRDEQRWGTEESSSGLLMSSRTDNNSDDVSGDANSAAQRRSIARRNIDQESGLRINVFAAFRVDKGEEPETRVATLVREGGRE